MANDSIFLKIARGEIPGKIVHQDENYLAFHDINPQAPVHILIVPLKLIENVNGIAPDDEALIGGMVTLGAKLAAELGVAESGYRLVLNCNRDGGQTVDHIHMHLLGGRPLTWPPG